MLNHFTLINPERKRRLYRTKKAILAQAARTFFVLCGSCGHPWLDELKRRQHTGDAERDANTIADLLLLETCSKCGKNKQFLAVYEDRRIHVKPAQKPKAEQAQGGVG